MRFLPAALGVVVIDRDGHDDAVGDGDAAADGLHGGIAVGGIPVAEGEGRLLEVEEVHRRAEELQLPRGPPGP
jgi:hypothetical protein